MNAEQEGDLLDVPIPTSRCDELVRLLIQVTEVFLKGKIRRERRY